MPPAFLLGSSHSAGLSQSLRCFRIASQRSVLGKACDSLLAKQRAILTPKWTCQGKRGWRVGGRAHSRLLLEEWRPCTGSGTWSFSVAQGGMYLTLPGSGGCWGRIPRRVLSLRLTGDPRDPWTYKGPRTSSPSQHSPDRQAPRSALLLPKSRTASPQVWVQGPPTDIGGEQEHARVQASC